MKKMSKKCSTDHRLIRKRFTTYKIGTLRVSVVNREKNVGCSQGFFHRLNQVNLWFEYYWKNGFFFSFFQGYSTLWFRNCDTFIKIRLKTSMAIRLKMLKILDQVIYIFEWYGPVVSCLCKVRKRQKNLVSFLLLRLTTFTQKNYWYLLKKEHVVITKLT